MPDLKHCILNAEYTMRKEEHAIFRAKFVEDINWFSETKTLVQKMCSIGLV